MLCLLLAVYKLHPFTDGLRWLRAQAEIPSRSEPRDKQHHLWSAYCLQALNQVGYSYEFWSFSNPSWQGLSLFYKRGYRLKEALTIVQLPCVKQIASEKLLYSTGSSAWCSVMTQKAGVWGRRSKRGGIYVYMQLIHLIVHQKLTQHCNFTRMLLLLLLSL